MMGNELTENELRDRIFQWTDDIHRMETEIGKILVGQRGVIRDLLIALTAGGHILLEGVPGLGKTLLAKTLAQMIDAKFSRIQCTPDLIPADLTGTNILAEEEGGRRRFEFQPGPVFANVLLADEINRVPPKTQSALLEAMEEHSVTVGGKTHPLEGLFFVIATQNPLEMEGTYPLPESEIDRFFGKILVPFPTASELAEIFTRSASPTPPRIEKVISAERILEMGAVARSVLVSEKILQKTVRMILNSHPDAPHSPESVRKYVRFGASPRGGEAILSGAKVRALLDRRFNVAEEDIEAVAPMALRHRIILNFEARAEGITADRMIDDLLKMK